MTAGFLDTVDSAAIVVEAGISYRQLDHWTRRGWLVAAQIPRGSGFPRVYDPTQVKVATVMGELGRILGVRAEVAHMIAESLIETGVYASGDYIVRRLEDRTP